MSYNCTACKKSLASMNLLVSQFWKCSFRRLPSCVSVLAVKFQKATFLCLSSSSEVSESCLVSQF
jgi:hypothetical protein